MEQSSCASVWNEQNEFPEIFHSHFAESTNKRNTQGLAKVKKRKNSLVAFVIQATVFLGLSALPCLVNCHVLVISPFSAEQISHSFSLSFIFSFHSSWSFYQNKPFAFAFLFQAVHHCTGLTSDGIVWFSSQVSHFASVHQVAFTGPFQNPHDKNWWTWKKIVQGYLTVICMMGLCEQYLDRGESLSRHQVRFSSYLLVVLSVTPGLSFRSFHTCLAQSVHPCAAWLWSGGIVKNWHRFAVKVICKIGKGNSLKTIPVVAVSFFVSFLPSVLLSYLSFSCSVSAHFEELVFARLYRCALCRFCFSRLAAARSDSTCHSAMSSVRLSVAGPSTPGLLELKELEGNIFSFFCLSHLSSLSLPSLSVSLTLSTISHSPRSLPLSLHSLSLSLCISASRVSVCLFLGCRRKKKTTVILSEIIGLEGSMRNQNDLIKVSHETENGVFVLSLSLFVCPTFCLYVTKKLCLSKSPTPPRQKPDGSLFWPQ